MAKRKMLFHPDYVREKIRASQLINRLQNCALGKIELTMPQIRAIEILLRKCLPDLAHTDISVDAPHRYVVEIPPTLDQDAWLKKYGGSSETIDFRGSPEIKNPESPPVLPRRSGGAVGSECCPRSTHSLRRGSRDRPSGCVARLAPQNSGHLYVGPITATRALNPASR